MNYKEKVDQEIRTWKANEAIARFSKKYGVSYKQAAEIIEVQKNLAEYKTTYKAK